MSFTTCYSRFYKYQDDGKIINKRPRILDMAQWEEFKSNSELPVDDMAIIEKETDEMEYPHRIYYVLHGFKTWKATELLRKYFENSKEGDRGFTDGETSYLGLNFNIERFGIAYQGIDEEFTYFFKELSKVIEQFVVFHSPLPYEFPNVFDGLFEDRDKNYFWAIKGNTGKVEIIKYRIDLEKVDEK